ncbi:hypothetical protein FRC09_012717 [Ceratobasidium sp. 395]|nr:hypothetical protein FRC09_012717 [Ceratobasidium sp. 395]
MTSNFGSRMQREMAQFVQKVERIHQEEGGKESEPHITRAENISRENDRLRKELYDLQQRVKILTDRLGFENLDRAEESLDEGLVGAVREHKAAATRIDALTAELASAKHQLTLEQAGRMEDQNRLESLKTELKRKKQLSLEAQAESELNREALGRLKLELQSEWQKTSKLESMLSSVRKENDAISLQCETLKTAAAKDRAQRLSLAPETPLRVPIGLDDDKLASTPQTSAPADTFINNAALPLEVQLTHLRNQYDELLASKTRLSEKYAQETAKLKEFKEKFRISSGGKGLVATENGLRTRGRVSKQAKDSPTPASRTANVPLPRITVPIGNVFIKQEESPFSPGYMDPIRRIQRDAGLADPDARQNLSPASNTDTQDSQSTPPVERPFNQDLPEPMDTTQDIRPALPTIKRSQSDDESSILLRRQVDTAPLARSHSSPAESPHNRRKTPASSKLLGKRKAMLFDGEGDSSDEEAIHAKGGKPIELAHEHQPGEPSREERDAQLRALRRKSGPQVLADYQQYKGRGRYAAGPANPADKTINSEYEIDPTRNNGMAFKFDAVIRDKTERRKLNAALLISLQYYEAVGPMPKRAGAPLWRSPPPEGNHQLAKPHTCKHHHVNPTDTSTNMTEKEDAAARKKAISRHRHNWAPASTPPGYWNIGFPDTQQVEDINRRAVELHQEKRNAIEQEAG